MTTVTTNTVTGNTGIGTGVVLEMNIEIEDVGIQDLGQGREADKGKDETEIERGIGIATRGATHLGDFAMTMALIVPGIPTDEVKNSFTDWENGSKAKA